MEMTADELTRQVLSAWGKIDKQEEEITKQKIESEKVKTILIGINGTNGLKGRVDDIDGRFTSYRQSVREDMKSMGEKFTEALDKVLVKINDLEKSLEKKEKDARIEKYTVIGLLLTLAGIVIAVIK